MEPTAKQRAIDAISELPDDAGLDQIMDRLYVIENVAAGEADVDAGRTITSTELKKQITEW